MHSHVTVHLLTVCKLTGTLRQAISPSLVLNLWNVGKRCFWNLHSQKLCAWHTSWSTKSDSTLVLPLSNNHVIWFSNKAPPYMTHWDCGDISNNTSTVGTICDTMHCYPCSQQDVCAASLPYKSSSSIGQLSAFPDATKFVLWCYVLLTVKESHVAFWSNSRASLSSNY